MMRRSVADLREMEFRPEQYSFTYSKFRYKDISSTSQVQTALRGSGGNKASVSQGVETSILYARFEAASEVQRLVKQRVGLKCGINSSVKSSSSAMQFLEPRPPEYLTPDSSSLNRAVVSCPSFPFFGFMLKNLSATKSTNKEDPS
ncbi:hypothetical protein Tco_0642549 [Tanacetum coccineum]